LKVTLKILQNAKNHIQAGILHQNWYKSEEDMSRHILSAQKYFKYFLFLHFKSKHY
jgi:hypothetical protein